MNDQGLTDGRLLVAARIRDAIGDDQPDADRYARWAAQRVVARVRHIHVQRVRRHGAEVERFIAGLRLPRGTTDMTTATPGPACADECGALLRSRLRELAVDAHVTHVPPLVPPAYKPLDMRCPHGVLWFVEPTGEQIAAWIRDGVE